MCYVEAKGITSAAHINIIYANNFKVTVIKLNKTSQSLTTLNLHPQYIHTTAKICNSWHMFNFKKHFKLQIRPPSLILLITTSQHRWIFPSQSSEVRNSTTTTMLMTIIIIIIIIITQKLRMTAHIWSSFCTLTLRPTAVNCWLGRKMWPTWHVFRMFVRTRTSLSHAEYRYETCANSRHLMLHDLLIALASARRDIITPWP